MHCPYCKSKQVIKHGKRKTKTGYVQIYFCKSCQKFFCNKKLKHKTYPSKVILNAISTFNLGYTLKQTSKLMAKRFKVRIPESTIHSWVKQYSNICTYRRLREKGRKLFQPEEIIVSKRLQHKQVYEFKLHRAKLELQAKELPKRKFELLKNYLEFVQTNKFPHQHSVLQEQEL